MIIYFDKPDSAPDMKALYEVALTLAKHGKAFENGEITKECAIKMALAKNFENMSLSPQTVARRVTELGGNVTLQLKEVVQQCKYYTSLWRWMKVSTSVTLASF